ncbi:avidin-like [Leptodactylus fuscus]
MVTSYYSHVGAHCNMTGIWVNNLGSLLRLSVEGSLLKGTLHTSVELSPDARCKQMTGELIGHVGQGDQQIFTMSVNWAGDSATVWVGQCFQQLDCPILKAMWLLRTKTTEEDNWMATRIGEDVFYPKDKCLMSDIL